MELSKRLKYQILTLTKLQLPTREHPVVFIVTEHIGDEEISLKMILGICLGAMAVVCIIIMAYFIRKQKSKAKKMFKSMLRGEVKMMFKLLLEVCELLAFALAHVCDE